MKVCKNCGELISDDTGNLCDRCLMKSKYNGVEKTINVLSTILLVGGIIASIILAFTIIYVEVENSFGAYSWETKHFSFSGLAITVSTLFSSILLWALLKLAIEASTNIRKIANK